jgi:uncharacterized protein
MFDPMTEDPTPDLNHSAQTNRVRFSSHGYALNGVYFLAQGEALKPTIVLLHGIPGTDRNFDLAHVYRRAGLNVLVFHYRGAWGSEGPYAFAHVLEDVQSALEWLVASSQELRADTARIGLVGHSLGGWAALKNAAMDARVKAVISIAGANLGAWWKDVQPDSARVASLEAGLASLTSIQHGATGSSLMAEMREHHEAWDLCKSAKDLQTKPVLLIAGTRDDDIPPALHHAPLLQALKAVSAPVTALEVNSDHMFADARIAVARATLSWLQQHL